MRRAHLSFDLPAFLQPLDLQSKCRVYALFTFSCNSKLKANLCKHVAPFRQAEKKINSINLSVSDYLAFLLSQMKGISAKYKIFELTSIKFLLPVYRDWILSFFPHGYVTFVPQCLTLSGTEELYLGTRVSVFHLM